MRRLEVSLRTMVQLLRPLLGLTVSMLFLTVLAYPLAVTGIAQVAFEQQANWAALLVGQKDAVAKL